MPTYSILYFYVIKNENNIDILYHTIMIIIYNVPVATVEVYLIRGNI